MNFTTLEHIREIINDGAIFWTLRDRNNSAILAEQTAGISAGDSFDKLTRNIKEMRGDFVKLTLSQRAQAEKSAGGNTKNYGPFNIEIQSNTNRNKFKKLIKLLNILRVFLRNLDGYY